MNILIRHIFVAVTAAFVSGFAVAEDTKVPVTDTRGLSDPPGLKRFAGSVLIYRDDVAYDEVVFPRSPGKYDDGSVVATDAIKRAGQRSAMQYVAPLGRSGLEIVRNYQQELESAGYQTVYECADEQCGDKNTFKLILPKSWKGKAADSTPMACSTAYPQDVRYILLDNPASGSTMAIATYMPSLTSTYCDEKAYKEHTGITVVWVDAKAREQRMETISASEIGKGLDANGKVAIYGILFDFNKADIKPESKPSLDQIGLLLKQQPTLKLHVVGHTDNVGSLSANLDLSRLRAKAVAAALVENYGIAAGRLTSNGVANLAPVASNTSEQGRAKNRRVELVLQ